MYQQAQPQQVAVMMMMTMAEAATISRSR